MICAPFGNWERLVVVSPRVSVPSGDGAKREPRRASTGHQGRPPRLLQGPAPAARSVRVFLARNTDWQSNVTYLQITPKNRSDIPEYLELAQAVDYLAWRIRFLFGKVMPTKIRMSSRFHHTVSPRS
jgi:hypothetical protein